MFDSEKTSNKVWNRAILWKIQSNHLEWFTLLEDKAAAGIKFGAELLIFRDEKRK